MTDPIRQKMRDNILAPEGALLRDLIKTADLSPEDRARTAAAAAQLVRDIRDNSDPGLMETFLEEYGLSTDEGIALMCLAEALLRVPDAETIDALIEDKIAPSDWGKHLGGSSSSLVNASTWALLLTGRVLDDEHQGITGALRGALRRLGEPVIRTAVSRAMKEMGRQFVLGRNITEAMERARGMEAKGFTYSYDMLGEAARTEADAKRYHLSYSRAISGLAPACTSNDIRENPGISVKLSALHPRYEFPQRDRVMDELVPRTRSLALLAKSAGMGFNIDAEEADRLDLSLDVINAVLADPSLKNWDGFGVVVQAYSKRAPFVIDRLYQMSVELDRKIMVRLVKGAYWDTEIKRAQTLGLEGFPVFTRKASTDVSYIANARKLLDMRDRIYPQFATHNAHTVAAIMDLAKPDNSYEFQRLHGMGEALHTNVLEANKSNCRIYAPVGAHKDLLAYLVRRLLENGANSSFVNQIVDEDVPPEIVAEDPFTAALNYLDDAPNPQIAHPAKIFGDRPNSAGLDITDPLKIEQLRNAQQEFAGKIWTAGPLLAAQVKASTTRNIINPADTDDLVGTVMDATEHDVLAALENAQIWDSTGRSEVLSKAAKLYETNAPELITLLTREAGKTLLDAEGEIREAVDFLRFYGDHASNLTRPACGNFVCISPWNFPLAIFTGQIAAALAAGNAVLAKPAEATPLIAYRATQLLHEAGVPRAALQLLPGFGHTIGAALAQSPKIDGLTFTGSTKTAQLINRAMAKNAPHAPLIAETGGLNAMIVDSTALPEQAVRDVIASSFQSAGQRCSALRVLYVQEDIAEPLTQMLFGAMDELSVGNPASLSTDVGPVIDKAAQTTIQNHIEKARSDKRILHECPTPSTGTFVAPTAISINGISDLTREIFGPVLHIATFDAGDIDLVVDDINASGYGLTFGLHTRIDDRVDQVMERLKVGNAYVNRNQIGAVVGSQPFGGEGLSGTGPKAGGPHYLERFTKAQTRELPHENTQVIDIQKMQDALNQLPEAFKKPLETIDLPGPTGESNRLSTHARGKVLCLGPNAEKQAAIARKQGCSAYAVNGQLPQYTLTELTSFDAVCYWGTDPGPYREALAERKGPIIPLITSDDPNHFQLERHLCIDTTASGGNAALLAASDPP